MYMATRGAVQSCCRPSSFRLLISIVQSGTFMELGVLLHPAEPADLPPIVTCNQLDLALDDFAGMHAHPPGPG